MPCRTSKEIWSSSLALEWRSSKRSTLLIVPQQVLPKSVFSGCLNDGLPPMWLCISVGMSKSCTLQEDACSLMLLTYRV